MIYLDNNATTQIAPEVLEAMHKVYREGALNASSAHTLGRKAKEILIESKEIVSSNLGVKEEEIYFLSGATEGLNLLLKGIDLGAKGILTSNAEHAAIGQILSCQKHKVHIIPVDKKGTPPLDLIERALKDHQIGLMIFSAVYTETGVKLPLQEVENLAIKYHVPFFLDAVGIIGKEPFRIGPGISAAVFSAHKFHGPQGIGAIYLRKSEKIAPLIHGGGQQKNLRSGTENIAGILGFATAFDLALKDLESKKEHMRELRDLLEKRLSPFSILNGSGPRVCNTSNLQFPGIDGETLLILLDREGVIASMGSACSSGSLSPSPVLQNMGLSYLEAKSSLRFSLSRYTTKEEIDKACYLIEGLIKRLS